MRQQNLDAGGGAETSNQQTMALTYISSSLDHNFNVISGLSCNTFIIPCYTILSNPSHTVKS